MNRTKRIGFVSAVIFVCVGLFGSRISAQNAPQFTSEFRFGDCNFLTRGNNPYFILQPEYQLLLEGEENGETARLLVTVLPRIKRISVPNLGTVTTRVVQEQHYEGGELVELSKNYFAICEKTGDVVYFGEDVDIFNPDGTVTHQGAWLAGRNGARPGIFIPGTFLLGSRYFQEVAPGIALDRVEHLAMGLQIMTPAGSFDGCVQTRETTPFEPNAVGFKKYCPGVGLASDPPVELVGYGFDIEDDDVK